MAVQIMRKANAVCVLPRELVGLSEATAGIREVRIEKALPQRNIAFWSRRKDNALQIHSGNSCHMEQPFMNV